MISPAGMAIAAVTVMLWLIWSDNVRPHRPAPILYAVRVALFIIVAGILVLNMFRHPAQFAGAARGWVIFAAAVGVFGAWYFARKLARR
jgi:positive regulator of sigma E activity